MTYSVYGAPAGEPVIALHGTPGSRLKFAALAPAAAEAGLKLIAVDRWGYGGSEPPCAPALEGYGDDLASLADTLGAGRISILAISGGGPFGAMAAERLGGRVRRLALVSPVGPMVDDGFTDVALFHRLSFGVLPALPGATRAAFGLFRLLLAMAPRAAVRVAAVRAPASDRLIVAEPSIGDALAAAFAEGLRPGCAGPAIDMRLFATAWRPACAGETTTHVWIGNADRNVPVAAARRLARMTKARLTELPGQGHYWFSISYRTVLAWLAGQSD